MMELFAVHTWDLKECLEPGCDGTLVHTRTLLYHALTLHAQDFAWEEVVWL